MKYQVDESFFSRIDENDIIEVYGPDGRRVFFSPKVLHFSSYSIEDIFVRPWYELYDRDEKYNQMIAEASAAVFSGKLTQAVDAEIPPHILSERDSSEKYRLQLTIRVVAPVHKSGNLSAIILSSNIKFVGV